MTGTMHQVDWRVSPYIAQFPHGRKHYIEIGDDLHIDTFTLRTFSLTVSAVWDWDLQIERVRMSRVAILQAARLLEGKGEQYTLEALIWDGWELPATWLRCGGIDRPGWFLGGVPVKAVLDETLPPEFAMLAIAEIPKAYPAYHRVFWSNSPEVDPDNDRLDTIIADHKAKTS